MTLKERFKNKTIDIQGWMRKYSYIVSPILGILLYLTLNLFVDIKIDAEFISNIVNISGVLAGFIFSAMGIIIGLPNNKFIEKLKNANIMDKINKAMIIGIITLLVSMLIGLFKISPNLTVIIFVVGISETFLSAYYLYKLTTYSSKSS